MVLPLRKMSRRRYFGLVRRPAPEIPKRRRFSEKCIAAELGSKRVMNSRFIGIHLARSRAIHRLNTGWQTSTTWGLELPSITSWALNGTRRPVSRTTYALGSPSASLTSTGTPERQITRKRRDYLFAQRRNRIHAACTTRR